MITIITSSSRVVIDVPWSATISFKRLLFLSCVSITFVNTLLSLFHSNRRNNNKISIIFNKPNHNNNNNSNKNGGFYISKEEKNGASPEEVQSPSTYPVLMKGDISLMKYALQISKEQFVKELSIKYGSIYWKQIFLDSNSKPRSLFATTDGNSTSYTRFKRKVMIKLLQAKIMRNRNLDFEKDTLIPFVWVTSGNSIAAGHGNLFNESYTAVLHRSMKRPLRALGLNFITRSYGMSAMKSAPELAFCQQEVYGNDIDILAWDFALTDGKDASRMTLSLYRAGYNPSQPVILPMQIGGRYKNYRTEKIQALEDLGLVILAMDDNVTKNVFDSIPDSFGLTDDQLNELPPYVRNYRCDKQLENGDPHCLEQKFSTKICPNRFYQTSWHPGWKWHAVIGYLAALTLFNVFADSMEELSDYNTFDASALLARLQQQEDDIYQRFYKSNAPTEYLQPLIKAEDVAKVDISLLAKTPCFCHTALLPAQIRFKGILTEKKITKSFDTGMGLRLASTSVNNHEYMRLVYTENDRFRQLSPYPNYTLEDDRRRCPVVTSIDYKDYFYLDNKEGWKKLILPNDSEMKEYGNANRQKLKGFVAICFTEICPYNNCPTWVLHREALSTGELLIQVNGVPVTNTTQLSDCDLLEHQDGLVWSLNDSGKIELQAKVTVPIKYLRISSIIVW